MGPPEVLVHTSGWLGRQNQADLCTRGEVTGIATGTTLDKPILSHPVGHLSVGNQPVAGIAILVV